MNTLDAVLARLEAGLACLPDKPEETARSTFQALAWLAAGEPLSAAAAAERPLPELTPAQREQLETLVTRRLAGEPLAHLSRRQRFAGLEMLAGPGALIPRHETELLVRSALSLLEAQVGQPLIVDACTGIGNVAAALAAARPQARVLACDLSAEAIALAQRNLDHLGLTGRVSLAVGDLLAPVLQPAHLAQVDLLTCNPPYISSPRRQTMAAEIADHEPSLAFDGGPLGITLLQRLIREAPALLKPGAWLVFEVGLGQGPAVERRLRGSGHYDDTRSFTDAAGDIRVLAGRRAADAPTA